MKTTLCILAIGLASIAVAQPAAPDSAAPLRYESAFADYKPWQDLRPADWRRVNEVVREAAAQGAGHGAHAGHAAPATPASAASAPARGGHANHGTHGGAK